MWIYESPRGDVTLRDQSITERVLEGLTDRLDEPVLIDGPTGRQMTARELIAGIKQLAGGLDARGLGKGHVIALMSPNIPEYCTVFHGACWAGSTVTTLNPTYTASEVRYQLQDSAAELLITIPAFLDIAQEAIEGTSVSEIVVIGEAEGATPLSALMGAPLEHQVPMDLDNDVAVLPYSSGTTGLPKGVMLSHRNLVANLDQMLTVADITPGERTPAFLPFFHIYGLEIMINLYLCAGSTLLTMPRFDLELFLTLIQEHRSKRIWIVPPVALALAKHPLIDQFDLSSLEQVNSAAAPLGAEVSEAVAARLNCNVTQAYGMTELSPATHVSPCDAPRAGSSGITIAGTQCRIVDSQTGSDLHPGEVGELWVRGPQVMIGYLNNPTATAETIDSEGWLRTGDIAHIDEDGYLFISDRLKELIKYKGFQVAPAELEAALLTHPGINDAAVIGLPDEEAGELPVAYIVPAGDPLNLEEVQAHLAKDLAHYKQIRQLHIIDAVPKSASGKILRRVLRDQLAAS